jgi:hypothetical protein
MRVSVASVQARAALGARLPLLNIRHDPQLVMVAAGVRPTQRVRVDRRDQDRLVAVVAQLP